MKNFITILTFVISTSIFAFGNDPVWEGVVSIPNDHIEAVILKNGVYTPLIDLQDGYELLDGVSVEGDNTFFVSYLKNFDVATIILSDGGEFPVGASFAASGGEMGGG